MFTPTYLKAGDIPGNRYCCNILYNKLLSLHFPCSIAQRYGRRGDGSGHLPKIYIRSWQVMKNSTERQLKGHSKQGVGPRNPPKLISWSQAPSEHNCLFEIACKVIMPRLIKCVYNILYKHHLYIKYWFSATYM